VRSVVHLYGPMIRVAHHETTSPRHLFVFAEHGRAQGLHGVPRRVERPDIEPGKGAAARPSGRRGPRCRCGIDGEVHARQVRRGMHGALTVVLVLERYPDCSVKPNRLLNVVGEQHERGELCHVASMTEMRRVQHALLPGCRRRLRAQPCAMVCLKPPSVLESEPSGVLGHHDSCRDRDRNGW